MSLAGKHILSIDQFNRSDLEKILAVAQTLEPVAGRPDPRPGQDRAGRGPPGGL